MDWKPFALAVAAVGLCGATFFTSLRPIKPPPGTADAYAGKPLSVVVMEKTGFVTSTMSMEEIVTAGGSGDGVISYNGVEDPAVEIAAKLSPTLAARMKTTQGKSLTDFPANTAEDVARAVGGDGVILAVETTTWMFDFYSTDWNHYYVTYYGRARLIDAASGKTLSLAPCKWESDSNGAPTYHEMLDNRAARLKQILAKAANDCLAVYQKDLLPE